MTTEAKEATCWLTPATNTRLRSSLHCSISACILHIVHEGAAVCDRPVTSVTPPHFSTAVYMWTGVDYLGESRWPRKGASSGVLDTCGFPKDGYYFYQSQWTREPMVHVLPHWNYPGEKGAIIPVAVYSNYRQVELQLNGRSYGNDNGAGFTRLLSGRQPPGRGLSESVACRRWRGSWHLPLPGHR